MPLGWDGDCQMRRTDVVRTSGNRMPTGGPGTVGQTDRQLDRLMGRETKRETYRQADRHSNRHSL